MSFARYIAHIQSDKQALLTRDDESLKPIIVKLHCDVEDKRQPQGVAVDNASEELKNGCKSASIL